MTEIIGTWVKIITDGSKLLTTRKLKIEEKGESMGMGIDAQKEAAILIFKARSLESVSLVLDYLAEELTQDFSRSTFLVMHLRTLLDVYSRLLYLAMNSDKTHQALVAIGYQLLMSKKLGPQAYESVLHLFEDFLDRAELKFPSSNEFNYGFLDRNGLVFPKKTGTLTPENTDQFSPKSKEVFKGEKVIEIYDYFSELIHGNPYYDRKGIGTECFWVVTMATSTTARILELIDSHTLGWREARDFREWLAQIGRHRGQLISTWQAQRAQNRSVR